GDWSSDVCSSDLGGGRARRAAVWQLPAQCRQHGLHVLWHCRFEAQALAAAGVVEGELAGVQHEAWRFEQLAAIVFGVDALAEQGMPALRQVNANLVRAPGFEPTFDEGRAAQRFQP